MICRRPVRWICFPCSDDRAPKFETAAPANRRKGRTAAPRLLARPSVYAGDKNLAPGRIHFAREFENPGVPAKRSFVGRFAGDQPDGSVLHVRLSGGHRSAGASSVCRLEGITSLWKMRPCRAGACPYRSVRGIAGTHLSGDARSCKRARRRGRRIGPPGPVRLRQASKQGSVGSKIREFQKKRPNAAQERDCLSPPSRV